MVVLNGGIASGEFLLFFFNDTATTEIYTLSLHDALPILSSLSPPHPPTHIHTRIHLLPHPWAILILIPFHSIRALTPFHLTPASPISNAVSIFFFFSSLYNNAPWAIELVLLGN